MPEDGGGIIQVVLCSIPQSFSNWEAIVQGSTPAFETDTSHAVNCVGIFKSRTFNRPKNIATVISAPSHVLDPGITAAAIKIIASIELVAMLFRYRL